jgi:phage terminase large subunit
VAEIACANCKQHPAKVTVVIIVKGQHVQTPLCQECYEDSVILEQADGTLLSWYTPMPHQKPYHRCDTPNLLALGTRDTGKSTMMRRDAIIRCMKWAGFKVLILRRKMTDLRKSHLQHIDPEMKMLGRDIGYYRETTHDVKFANGSFIQFSHCEHLKDVTDYLSSEWDLIVFDEVSTFTLEMFLTISAAARSPEQAPYHALVRCGSNPLGIGAMWMKCWFIDHAVDLQDYEDYDPDDFEMQFSTLDQNRYVDRAAYEKRLKVLPAHIKKAWLKGEFVVEGAYFPGFRHMTDDEDSWHVIDELPLVPTRVGDLKPFLLLPWINIYRGLDWGFNPDPAVCLWIAVLPNQREIVFKERSWKKTLAQKVAKAIVRESAGMHIVETFCDPSIFAKDGNVDYSIADTFEVNGVPLTASINDRMLFGYAVTEHLETLITTGADGVPHPKMQILDDQGDGDLGCKDLLRTIPIQTMDVNDPRKLAAGEDHWVVALAYFCMGRAMPATDPKSDELPFWMRRKKKRRRYAHI